MSECHKCKHFLATGKVMDENGACYRYPPVWCGTKNEFIRPAVTAFSTCGEYSRRSLPEWGLFVSECDMTDLSNRSVFVLHKFLHLEIHDVEKWRLKDIKGCGKKTISEILEWKKRQLANKK